MGKYRKKPVVIEAIQFTGKNFFEIHEFTNGNAHDCYMQPDGHTTCIINTLEGRHIATEGDYIIRGVHGEFYPCKPDIFDMTYDMVDQLKTRADRIRAMTDEEWAKFVANKIVNIENHKMIEQGHTPTATQLSALGHTCYCTLVQWLKQPAEGDA